MYFRRTLCHLWSAGLKPAPSTLNPDVIFLKFPLKGINVVYIVKKGWLFFLKDGVDMLSQDCLFLVSIVNYDTIIRKVSKYIFPPSGNIAFVTTLKKIVSLDI